MLTLGKEGVVIRTREIGVAVPLKEKNVKVVDTTGAGDSFLGAFVYFLSLETAKEEEHYSKEVLVAAAEEAGRVASLSVGFEGCQPSYEEAAKIYTKKK